MSKEKDSRLSRVLIKWYNEHKRELPWRDTSDPYIIWLSEIILQQTRVDQGLAYFTRFVRQYPSVGLLANAKEDEILKLWQGLGYYSRARNLHATAKMIMNDCGGVFPRAHKDVLRLKGVGDYTAAAIVSFAYNDPYAVVDGNVFRVLSRIFAIAEPIDTNRGKKVFMQLASNLLDDVNPGLHNQAIMEFGALQCVPVSPDCEVCPASSMCLAYAQNKVNEYPVKGGKQKVRNRYFHYFDIRCGNYMFLHKRTAKDIWLNLFEFPLLETENDESLEELSRNSGLNNLIRSGKNVNLKFAFKTKHVLSHQVIYATFYRVDVDAISIENEYLKIKIEDVEDYPVSRLVHKYLERL